MTLHQKVHQEIPVNNELSVAFARAFAYEHCKSAKEENNPEMYRVAWAVAGEASVRLLNMRLIARDRWIPSGKYSCRQRFRFYPATRNFLELILLLTTVWRTSK